MYEYICKYIHIRLTSLLSHILLNPNCTYITLISFFIDSYDSGSTGLGKRVLRFQNRHRGVTKQQI